jgi:hypothetical protein
MLLRDGHRLISMEIMMKRACPALLAIFCAASAFAGEDPAGDKIMHAYVLTMPKVQAYDAATVTLYQAEQKDPALKAESKAMAHEPSDTVAELRGKMDRHPSILRFFQDRGLARDDAALLPFVLLDACSAAQAPKPKPDPSISPQQIAFCKANQAKLQQLKMFSNTLQ